ncbi:unnamed protein product, partial [Prorocentrum cordatum]
EDLVYPGNLDSRELARLEVPIELAVRNLVHRGMDRDGNAGVLFERMGQAMLRCSVVGPADPQEEQEAAARRRALSRQLLERARPLVEECTRNREADLTHISGLIRTELQLLDQQDAAYRKKLGASTPSVAALP